MCVFQKSKGMLSNNGGLVIEYPSAKIRLAMDRKIQKLLKTYFMKTALIPLKSSLGMLGPIELAHG